MIAFDLECAQGHIFEGWFSSIESFEIQNDQDLIICPYCNDKNIRRVISPVTTKNSSRKEEETVVKGAIDYRRLAREVMDYINQNFDDVGPDFTKEALKMHYGVTEKKNIKGSATTEEEKVLREEGIEFFKVPIPNLDDKKKN